MTPEEQKEMLDNAYAAGFAPHSSMHSSTDGMVTFCVWETTMDIKDPFYQTRINLVIHLLIYR